MRKDHEFPLKEIMVFPDHIIMYSVILAHKKTSFSVKNL